VLPLAGKHVGRECQEGVPTSSNNANCPVSMEDGARAEAIYGINMAALKGRTGRTTLDTVGGPNDDFHTHQAEEGKKLQQLLQRRERESIAFFICILAVSYQQRE
jgi:hypothetical protein